MRRKLLLMAAAVAWGLAQPSPALAESCEDICGERAAANCEDIDSLKCGAYILGCLSGCSTGKIIALLIGE
ncbi:MAG: hypothetical protein PVJ43_11105 [Gemmatimonadales bacterium]|jgi:hypothetical protein